jgi:hypothetical protein
MAKGILFIESANVVRTLLKTAPDCTNIYVNKIMWHNLSKENGFRNLTELLKAFKKEGLNIHKITVR